MERNLSWRGNTRLQNGALFCILMGILFCIPNSIKMAADGIIWTLCCLFCIGFCNGDSICIVIILLVVITYVAFQFFRCSVSCVCSVIWALGFNWQKFKKLCRLKSSLTFIRSLLCWWNLQTIKTRFVFVFLFSVGFTNITMVEQMAGNFISDATF